MREKLSRARKALAKGDVKVAANLYGRLIEEHEDLVPALLEGSHAFSQLGKVVVAERCLDRVVGLVDGDPEVGLHLASGYFAIGRREKSLAILNGIFDRTGSPEMAVALAELCERTGDVERGAEVLEGVDLARAVLLRGIFAKREGDVATAKRCFENVLSVEREDLDLGTKYRAGMELALCHEEEGRADEAWKTMETARAEVMPRGKDLEKLDRDFGRAMAAGVGSYDDFVLGDEGEAGENFGPCLVGGHAGSGVGDVAGDLVETEGFEDLGEVNAFVRLMGTTGLDAVPPGKMKEARLERFRGEYRKQVREYLPGVDKEKVWLEWGEGMERCGAYWLRAFPAGKVYLARRHPLDVVVENLFTFAPVNALTLQHFSAERAMGALEKSLEIQELLVAAGGDRVEVVDCEAGAGRWLKFRDFLPQEMVERFGDG